VTSRRKAGDGFVLVPNQLVELLFRGEVTFAQLGIAVVLLFRAWRDGGETAFTLVELEQVVRWPWSTEKLRKDLHALGQDGVLFKVSSPGRGAGHNGWRVAVGDAWEFNSNGVPVRLLVENGTAAAAERQNPTATSQPGAYTDAEVDKHSAAAVRERISQSLAEGTPSSTFDPLEALVAELRDADDQTLTSFRREFGRLTEADIAGARESLRARRARKGAPLKSDAGYTRMTLRGRLDDRRAATEPAQPPPSELPYGDLRERLEDVASNDQQSSEHR
jgi:hypothetical protein